MNTPRPLAPIIHGWRDEAFMLRAQVYNFPDGLDARYPFEVTWSNPDETFICAYDLTFE